MWLEYNLNAVIGWRPKERLIFVDYENLLMAPLAELRRLAEFLRLPINKQKGNQFITDFLDVRLNHAMQRPFDGPFSRLSLDVYAILNEIARGVRTLDLETLQILEQGRDQLRIYRRDLLPRLPSARIESPSGVGTY